MAVQKFLEELSVQQLITKYNFIVPEIQREYVWGNNEFKILDKFFSDIKEAINESNTNELDSIQIHGLEKMLERADEKDKDNIRNLIDTYLSKKDLNIGFLYSYRPDYYIYNDRNDDVYLIDGQQRLTTLFLALFYFALKENKYNDFKLLFRFDEQLEKLAFDYRVRTLTHNFLIDLVANCNTLSDLTNIEKKNWFLTNFADDVTVKAMIAAIIKLQEHFNNDSKEYYQFVLKQIRFWHFKTEETSQGEELYITMNSRGQQLADNETVRAKLFENDRVKANQIECGSKWEIWQDFFWKSKPINGNADNGLNQFLRWVNIIMCFSTKTFKTKELAEKEYKSLISENQVLDYVSLFEIEPYFDALEQLRIFDETGLFSIDFHKNNFSKDWLKGDLGQIHLVKLLPALMYLKYKRPVEGLNSFIRFFSNITNDTDISKNPDTYIIECIQLVKLFLDSNYNDIVDIIEFKSQFPRILSKEEVCKLSLFKNEKDINKREILQKAFWELEDLKINKGKIGHLLQMSTRDFNADKFTFNYSFDYLTIKEIDIDDFLKISKAYKELINHENEIWGELLITSVYFEENDRIYAVGNWHLTEGFLNFCLERKRKFSNSLTDFLINREKRFILKYHDETEIENVKNPKKQLYIYYILHKRLLNNWNWSKWNFGFYDGDDYPKVSTIFIRNLIYQFYNSQWRYNIGYYERNGIWLQDNYKKNRNYISELINWAKS